MVLKIIFSSILLTFSTVGIFIIFGLIYNLIENKNLKYINYTFGTKGILITGIIGTTIHELSHYIMCKIFAHKVREVKLFTPYKYEREGILGYVYHSYNPKSIYQNIGNFFIGIAPMILGGAFIALCFKLFFPDIYIELSGYVIELIKYNEGYSINRVFLVIKEILALFIGMFLSIDNFLNFRFWIFIFIMCSITSHMSLSSADLKNSRSGIGYIFILSIVISLLGYILNINLQNIAKLILIYNIYFFYFLFIGIVFSLLSLFIFYLISKVVQI
ncbi:hypothetical protein EAI30_14800 [Romboutsia ilealis]|uniref:Integral membrane protein n=1 Tax=Romboutsia faecis TaxID=2764597 RepID=A0ABR7JJT7_9FIRM|nr:hypothetical protein [Romboutsia faecis]MBC5995169.1 hypothetical protein [Romboutsia faecis]MRN25887.1 hypothetical protein [Romboutsia ilealis]